ncbi:MAG: hypothetical protein SPK35_00495 [Prevotella sp.]|nr:hypothetical protein [Prevotella sp.]MDY5182170.1 hypothetical protein [Prevotella sp.]
MKWFVFSLAIMAILAPVNALADNNADSTRVSDSQLYIGADSLADINHPLDSATRTSKYDKRVHYMRQHWASLIPTQHIMQFAGNMGLVSIGVGWDYGKRRQWETHLLIGYIPKYDSHRAKVTMTLKQNYIPWSIYLRRGWALEPLECGLYFNTVYGHEFWAKQPTKYSGGYYPFSTKFRPNIFVGQRVTKIIPNSRRKAVKSITAFYELSTCDIYFMKFYRNGEAKFWDVFGLSLGVKFQVL